ncbi:MAG: galactose mutarotase [Solobacterium sp.]|nr:galactose mutarotase [Solobacterium sp.]
MKEVFGKTEEGRTIWLWTIENENLIMKVTNFGAALVSFIDRKTGIDVVKGYKTGEEYVKANAYLGASVGRTANRIKNGRFTLDGKTYQLPINNGPNCNHGGLKGFSYVLWDTEVSASAVIFTRRFEDGEEGFPGAMNASITYALDGNGITITAEAESDARTLFAYTNHAYFNADNSTSVLNQQLCVRSDVYSPQDDTNVTLCENVPVEGTPFDFRTPHLIGERIDEADPQLLVARGYDHWYPIGGSGMREMAVLSGSKLELIVSSDMPGIHVYTSNWFTDETGKYGETLVPRSAVALEASFRPNAVNYPEETKKPIIEPDENYAYHIRFRLRPRERSQG